MRAVVGGAAVLTTTPSQILPGAGGAGLEPKPAMGVVDNWLLHLVVSTSWPVTGMFSDV